MEKCYIKKKRFGQHFLIDQAILQKIMDVVSPKQDQLLVEIGPGTGALTKFLLKVLPSLIAVEVDRDLVFYLKRHYSSKLTIIHQDILNLNFNLLSLNHKKKKFRIIGNLPYNISTPIIFHLINFLDVIDDMTFLVQKEIALRLSALPNCKHYCRLSVMTALHVHTKTLFHVPPNAFDPPPHVNSTLIKLIPKKPVLKVDPKYFTQIVCAAFSQNRKKIRNSLKWMLNEDQILSVGIDPDQRPRCITVQGFVDLSNAYQQI